MELRKLEDVAYHPIQEKIVDIVRTKTQNLESDLYFRVLASFYLSQIATSMRCIIDTPHRGKLPTNMFALNLAESGAGKGYSMNLLERQILKPFRDNFLSYTFPEVAEVQLQNEANSAAVRNSTDPNEELERVQKEFKACGNYLFSYDSGTAPAYKQLRTKCQMANVGSLNMIVDEIGTNLLSNTELFGVNLEAYDIGLIKTKLVKNTSDNTRGKDRDDPVPSNMLCFGTPTKLFNGGMEEREIMALFDTGYARRFMYGFGHKTTANQVDAEALYKILTSGSVDQDIDNLAYFFGNMADMSNYAKTIKVDKNVALINLQYQLNCEAIAENFSEYEPLRKAEMQHRYFKALKLAGTYAFIDGTMTITEDQMYAAIKLTEDSGKCFESILHRERPYMRLAKYICTVKREVTHADLSEDLPFYPSAKAAREDMLQLATAWGYHNNCLIKRQFDDGIEFLTGDTLTEVDLNKLRVSYSTHEAYNYLNKEANWDKLPNLTQKQGIHWVNHHLEDGHRAGEKVMTGFDMIIIDVDEGVTIDTVQMLLAEYKHFIYTTKRHTEDNHRFRIIFPMKYHLKLNEKDYKDFMNNIFEWLPFPVDEGTDHRCKKWLSHDGEYFYNEGELFDPVMFIPKTSKNAERQAVMQDLSNLDRIEAWFARSMVDGSRNNTILKYALMLLDSGMAPDMVEDSVIAFNEKLKNKLTIEELQTTVIKTVWSKANGSN